MEVFHETTCECMKKTCVSNVNLSCTIYLVRGIKNLTYACKTMMHVPRFRSMYHSPNTHFIFLYPYVVGFLEASLAL